MAVSPATSEAAAPARGSFVSHTAIGVAGNAITAIVSVVYVSLLGHLLAPADYGVVVAVLSFGYILSLLLSPLEGGISKLAAGFHGQNNPGGLRTLAFEGARRSVLPCFLLMLLWWPLTYLLRRWLRLEGISELLWLGGLWVLAIPTAIVRGVLRGDHRFVDYSITQILESVVRVAVGAAAVFFGARAVGALAGYVVGSGAALLFTLWQLRALRRWPPIAIERREVLSTSLPLVFVYFFLTFTSNFDVLAAKHYLSPEQAGAYGAPATLVRMIFLGATPVYQVLFSHVTARHAQNHRSDRLTLWVAVLLAAALLASLLIPLFAGARILSLLFGAAYAASVPALRVMWLSTSLLVLEAVGALALVGVNRTRGAWGFLLSCALMVALLSRHHGGLVEIATCSLISVASGALVLVLMAVLSRPLRGTGASLDSDGSPGIIPPR